MRLYAPLDMNATGEPDMDEYYSYGLDSDRELDTLILDMFMGVITPREVVELLKGHPCEGAFLALYPDLKDCTEPPDDDTSSST